MFDTVHSDNQLSTQYSMSLGLRCWKWLSCIAVTLVMAGLTDSALTDSQRHHHHRNHHGVTHRLRPSPEQQDTMGLASQMERAPSLPSQEEIEDASKRSSMAGRLLR